MRLAQDREQQRQNLQQMLRARSGAADVENSLNDRYLCACSRPTELASNLDQSHAKLAEG